MKIKIFLGIIVVLASLGAVGFFFIGTFTGKAVISTEEGEIESIHTQAVCGMDGDERKCRDFEIWCLDGEAVRMDPVSGMVIFPDNWVDKRENKELCGK